jgi:hypothetical protein
MMVSGSAVVVAIIAVFCGMACAVAEEPIGGLTSLAGLALSLGLLLAWTL